VSGRRVQNTVVNPQNLAKKKRKRKNGIAQGWAGAESNIPNFLMATSYHQQVAISAVKRVGTMLHQGIRFNETRAKEFRDLFPGRSKDVAEVASGFNEDGFYLTWKSVLKKRDSLPHQRQSIIEKRGNERVPESIPCGQKSKHRPNCMRSTNGTPVFKGG